MLRILSLTVISVLACVLSAQAQPNPGSTKVEPKIKAPISKEPLRVNLPGHFETRLDNGLAVLLIEDHRLPEVSIRLQIRGAGSAFDPPGMAGLADVTSAMLSQGTTSRTAREIAEQTDLLSSEINAFTPSAGEETVFRMSGLTENFDRWFDLGIDELLHPAFPEDEWRKMKARRLATMQTQGGNPFYLAFERFNQAVFGVHPAGAIATPATLEAITVDAIRKWHEERYAPQNAILGIVGDVKPNKLLPKLKAAFSSWKRNDYHAPAVPDPDPVNESRILLVTRPGSVQTSLLAGNIAISRRDPDYETAQVVREFLQRTIRNSLSFEHDYSYVLAVRTSFTAGEFAGSWQVQAPFRTEVTGEAVGEILNEILKMRGDKAGQIAILEKLKVDLVRDFVVSLEYPNQVLQYTIDSNEYNLPAGFWDSYASKISNVTIADVQRFARKYLNPETMQIVAVGDASKIRTALEKYGKVTVYDTGGNVLH